LVTCTSSAAIPAGGSSSFGLIVGVGPNTAGPAENCAVVVDGLAPDNNRACDPTRFMCVPLTTVDFYCSPFFSFRICNFQVLAADEVLTDIRLESVTTSDGTVAPFSSDHFGSLLFRGFFVVDSSETRSCLSFRFSGRGGGGERRCQTEHCFDLPP